MAAVLASGQDAVLNHPSAAALFRTTRFPASIPHVLAPGHHRPIAGIVLHSYRHLGPLDVTVFRGIPVANVIYEAAFRKRFDLGATRRAMPGAHWRVPSSRCCSPPASPSRS